MIWKCSNNHSFVFWKHCQYDDSFLYAPIIGIELIRQLTVQIEDFTIEINFGTSVTKQVPVKEKDVFSDKSYILVLCILTASVKQKYIHSAKASYADDRHEPKDFRLLPPLH